MNDLSKYLSAHDQMKDTEATYQGVMPFLRREHVALFRIEKATGDHSASII